MIASKAATACAPDELAAVDEEGRACRWRRPSRPAPGPAATSSLIFGSSMSFLNLADVEPQLLGVLLEVGALERLLVGEHLVVHLPGLALAWWRPGRPWRRPARCRGRTAAGSRTRARRPWGTSRAICLRPSAPTREQNGHWKSLNSTMVTLACFGPLRGLCAGMSPSSRRPRRARPPAARRPPAGFGFSRRCRPGSSRQALALLDHVDHVLGHLGAARAVRVLLGADGDAAHAAAALAVALVQRLHGGGLLRRR